MHRCVCIWRYILQNYNYKLHFQNLSTYHIPYVSMGTLAAENLDVCTTCDPWDSNIQLTVVKDRRPGPGMPFLDNDTCVGGGLIYFCQGFLPCMMPSMDGWRDEWMDGKSLTITTSFTISHTWKSNHGQTIWDKTCGALGNVLWITLGISGTFLKPDGNYLENILRTHWEQKKQKKSPSPLSLSKFKTRIGPWSLLIGCMKILFTK